MDQHLAAILVADVEGFTNRMQNDEPRTIDALIKLRENVLLPTITRYKGKTVNSAGDGAMAIFDSCVDAVRCALDIQRANSDGDLRLRIGINLGEITREGETVHGHGINIASRIEALAEPGGIVVSSTVRNIIQGQLHETLIPMGRRKVKNIDEPVNLFAIKLTGPKFQTEMNRALRKILIFASAATTIILIGIFGWRALPVSSGIETPDMAESAPLTDPASVAVLPITLLSSEPDDRLWSIGLARNIVADLTEFEELFVFAADTSSRFMDEPNPIGAIREELGVHYVITGSLQRIDEDFRLVIHVVDTKSRRNTWSEKFDFKSGNLLTIQSDIAENIAQKIGPLDTGKW